MVHMVPAGFFFPCEMIVIILSCKSLSSSKRNLIVDEFCLVINIRKKLSFCPQRNISIYTFFIRKVYSTCSSYMALGTVYPFFLLEQFPNFHVELMS